MRRRELLYASMFLPFFGAKRLDPVRFGDKEMKRLKSFGLQLSTITPILANDFEGTLAKVSQIGYRLVEFSAMGYLGREAEEVKDLLAKYQLKSPVGRVAFKVPPNFMSLPREEQMKIFGQQGTMESLQDRIADSISDCRIMGQKILVIPAIMPHVFSDMDQINNMLKVLKESSKRCADAGITLGYHNHNWEFNEVDGVLPFDLMLQEMPSATFTFQLDTYWVRKAGRNLIEMLENNPGRFSTCHFKDINIDGDFEDVGHGQIDFPEFTREAIKRGAKYFFVERDTSPDPMESIRRSFAYLQTMKY